MNTLSARHLLACLLLSLVLPWGAVTSAHAEDIILVASYHATDACGQPQYQAAMDALKQGGFTGLSAKGYFLDTRVQGKEEVAKTIAQIKQDIRTNKPKVVFTIDDAAFAMLYEEVLRHPTTRLVFTGLNRKLEDYNQKARFLDKRTPTANITGVFEYLFMREQFEFLEIVLKKSVNKVAVLYSTDAIGHILKDQIIDELKDSKFQDRLVLFPAEDVPGMLKAARQINANKQIDAYIPVTMSLPDPSDNRRKTMQELTPLLIKEIKKIDLSLNDSFTEYGFFGGVSVDFYQMGFQSGFMATKLLKGGAIKEIAIENARRSIVAINRKRMRELGIRMNPETQSIVDKWIQ
jgi:ABC-type uncharacterized transport system substrate-binding protein